MSICPHFFKVNCPKFLVIQKSNGKKWSHISLSQFFKDQEVIQQGSGGYTTRIRRLYNKDHKVIQQGSEVF